VSNTKCAVYIVTLPEGFDPTAPWDLPPRILAGEILNRRLSTLYNVLGFARLFNTRQIESGLADRRWAIPVRRGHAFCRPDDLDVTEADPDSLRRWGLKDNAALAEAQQSLLADVEAECASSLRTEGISQEMTASPLHPLTPSPNAVKDFIAVNWACHGG
jgi:hypothetical protein